MSCNSKRSSGLNRNELPKDEDRLRTPGRKELATRTGAFGPRSRLEAHLSREFNLCHRCHEFPEKNSKIVPLSAPLFSITYRLFALVDLLHCNDSCRYPLIFLSRSSGSGDDSIRAEPIEFLNCDSLLCGCRVDESDVESELGTDARDWDAPYRSEFIVAVAS